MVKYGKEEQVWVTNRERDDELKVTIEEVEKTSKCENNV